LWILKCGITGVKITKIANFWYNFAKRGIPPYAIFTKFGLGKESQIRAITPNFIIVALKCGFTAPNIVKNGNFWYKFSHKEKFKGATVKVLDAHQYFRCLI